MTHRERILAAFDFKPTDRPPLDLMEGRAFGDMRAYFAQRNAPTLEAMLCALGADCRWVWCHGDTAADYARTFDTEIKEKRQPGSVVNPHATYSDAIDRPLQDCQTAAQVTSAYHPEPWRWQPPDFVAARRRWPEHALVLAPEWFPLFCGLCEFFGMETALAGFYERPAAVDAFLEIRNEAFLDILARALAEGRNEVDIVWLGDDYASEQSLLMSPDTWRRFIKPHLQKQVDMIHRYGKKVLLHSCGAVSSLYPDWIDMGIDGHLVFQTTAAGMSVERIAGEFGGKITFYGGIDVQRLLVSGTPEAVRAEVKRNVRAFQNCGGYIVANSHHGLPDIRPDLIHVMACSAMGMEEAIMAQ